MQRKRQKAPGLGLYIVRSIIKKHGGQNLCRKQRRRQRKHIYRPIAEDCEWKIADSSIIESMKILIVEDEKHLAEGLRFNLEAEGFEVEIAADGRQALEILASENNVLTRLCWT